MDWKPRIIGGTHVIDGVRATLSEHAERLGIGVGALRWRLQNSGDVTQAQAREPITREEAGRFMGLREEGYTAVKAAEAVGRPYNSLKNAAKRFFPEYEAVVDQSCDQITREEVERFVKLRINGDSAAKAAEVIGRSHHSLRRAAKRLLPEYDQVIEQALPGCWKTRKQIHSNDQQDSFEAA